MFITKKVIAFLIILSVIMTGCSSVSKSDMKDFFRSDIRADDSKMFTFTVIVTQQGKKDKKSTQKNSKSKGGRDSGKKGGQQNSQRNTKDNSMNKNDDHMTELFEELLIERLEKNQYCRDGYIELDRAFSGSTFTLRGECNESATENDRKRFYNKNSR